MARPLQPTSVPLIALVQFYHIRNRIVQRIGSVSFLPLFTPGGLQTFCQRATQAVTKQIEDRTPYVMWLFRDMLHPTKSTIFRKYIIFSLLTKCLYPEWTGFGRMWPRAVVWSCFFSVIFRSETGMFLKWPKKLSHFGQNVWKYKLMNTLTARFNTAVRQMTEMFQWPKFLSQKWPKCSSEKKQAWRPWFPPRNVKKAVSVTAMKNQF